MHLEIWLAGVLSAGVSASYFAGAQRIALLVMVPLTLLQVVVSPVISRLRAYSDLAVLEQTARSSSSVLVGTACLLCVPLLVVPGNLLLLVFGNQLLPAASLLPLLGISYVLRAASGLSSMVLSMSNFEGIASSFQWAEVVARGGVGTWALMTWGPIGLAVSSLLVSAATVATLWWLSYRHLGIRSYPTVRPSLRLLARVRA
ncbi:MAG: lipopolysaccharide biosynthesis protein [Nocardioidaceae bacterium]